DGALGIVLADDEAVELGDDFAGRERGHRKPKIEPRRHEGTKKNTKGYLAAQRPPEPTESTPVYPERLELGVLLRVFVPSWFVLFFCYPSSVSRVMLSLV